MGSDVQQVLTRNAETFLENAKFDGKSRSFTWDKFVGRLRQAFRDLGPEDQMSEQRKVTKLVRAFQVPGLQHLDAMITGDPVRQNNFEAAIVFLSDQMAALRTKNTGSHARTLGAMDSEKNGKPYKKRQKNRHHTNDSGDDASGFDKTNPGKYVPASVWNKYNQEEQDTAKKARNKAGIKTREERKLAEESHTEESDAGSETDEENPTTSDGEDTTATED